MAAAGMIETRPLPPSLEAAEPPEARGLRRDDVRLLVSRVVSDTIAHARFSELTEWLAPGDVVVVNTSGTLNAAVTAAIVSPQPARAGFPTAVPASHATSGWSPSG